MCTATMGHRGPIGVQDDADMRKCIQEVSCKRRLLPALAAKLCVGLGPVLPVAPQTLK